MGPWTLVGIVFLACLPRDDLATYSNSSGGAGGSLPSLPGGGAPTDAGGQANGGQDGEDNPANLPLSSGGEGGADGSTQVPGDAGSEDAAVPTDAGVSADAGFAASQCAATQGTLVPDSNVCLFFAAEARVSWQAATLACQTRSSTLVSVKTLQLDGFLSSLIDTEIWLGAADPGTNPASNAFVWRDNTLVDVNMETWAASEPDEVADQFCVSKSPPIMGGQWRDRPCTELRAYVCERTF
ncbi:MAG: hypothetical protein RL033_2764 [Pseudomonadota bacterium]